MRPFGQMGSPGSSSSMEHRRGLSKSDQAETRNTNEPKQYDGQYQLSNFVTSQRSEETFVNSIHRNDPLFGGTPRFTR